MQMYFKVRSVLLSHGSSAITLSPVSWLRDHPTETEEIDGLTYAKSVECRPGDEGAEAIEDGGKLTELRLEGQTDLRPDEYVTLTVGLSL